MAAGEDVLGTAIIELRASFEKLSADLDKAKAQANKSMAAIDDAKVRVMADTDEAIADIRGVGKGLDGLEDESVRVTSDTGTALGEVRSLDKALDGIEDETVKVDVDTSGAKADLGGLRNLIGGVAVGAAGKAMLDLGTQMEVLAAKADIVFGDEALGQVQAWASTNAASFGTSDEALVGMAAGLGDLLVPMGFARTQAAGMSTDVLGLAGALSLWSGGTYDITAVSGMLTDALLGETDALKGLGINISAADVAARVAANGQAELTGQALKQAEAMATQQLLLEQTTDAQRFFAEGGSAAMASQNALNASWDEATAQLSTSLLPMMSTAVGVAGAMAGGFAMLPAPVQAAIVVLGALVLLSGPLTTFAGLFAAGGPIVTAGTATLTFVKGTMVPGLMTAFSTLMAHPMVLVIVAALALLVAVGWGLYQNWDKITAAVGASWDWLGDKVSGVVDWVGDRVGGLVDFITGVPRAIAGALDGVFDGVVAGFKMAWNTVARVVNAADFTLPSGIPLVGGKTIGLPDLPMLAKGGSITRSGFAMVGEKGPEVRWLNKGEAISPIGDAGPAGRGGGSAPVINVVVEGQVTSSRDLVYAIADGLDEMGWRRG